GLASQDALSSLINRKIVSRNTVLWRCCSAGEPFYSAALITDGETATQIRSVSNESGHRRAHEDFRHRLPACGDQACRSRDERSGLEGTGSEPKEPNPCM